MSKTDTSKLAQTPLAQELLARVQAAPNGRIAAVDACRGLSWSRAYAVLEALVIVGVLKRYKRGLNPNPDYALT
jgi:hypothetical protein